MSFDTHDKLDSLYKHIQAVILSRQHPVTGLFPASTSINNHGNYTDAWVRDNVYSIQAVWALHLAYKRANNPDKRSHELEYACVKMMRGLLFAMMRQSHKVEKFKHSLDPKDALHAKYDTKTGLEAVADDAWGHLQIDATSFYLLMLGQMTKAGTTIVFSHDEFNFIQNLIYYIARTYRTPDYGIWERGNKVNNGKAEINASSVGMAKAAMEALDGLNLFGEDGPEWAVIHSFPDAVARAGSVLESLLPKESQSKEVDAAVLSIISFPAFAVNNEKLTNKTRKEIISKLGGHYGCKRFLLDGHQSVLEDQSRIYYEYDELINFEHIESEWPLFFTYLYIDRLFARDWESANYYRHKLDTLMVEKEGHKLLPELYYVPKENILAEKEKPGSQSRVANDNLPLVWAQSLYLVGTMLDDELIRTDDLDPLGLHRNQHKAHNVTTSMVILAQNTKVKDKLQAAGCLCQTLDEIAPIKAISAEQLVKTYQHLGASQALELTGRPDRALNSLATSQAFCINDQNYLCLSWIQNEDKDYRKIDPILFKAHIENELTAIAEGWYYRANAVFTLLIDEAISTMQGCDELFEFIRKLQNRELEEYRVIPQSAKNSFKSGNRRTMNIEAHWQRELGIHPAHHDYTWPLGQEDKGLSHDLTAQSTEQVLANLTKQPSLQEALNLLLELGSRRALMQTIPGSVPAVTAQKVLNSVYIQALLKEEWRTARLLFAQIIKPSTDLATYIADITVRQRKLVIGETHETEISINSPIHQDDILETLLKTASSPLSLVIAHEVIAVVGTLIKLHPESFNGIRTIRVHSLACLCARKFDDSPEHSVFDTLASISPSQLYDTLKEELDSKNEEFHHVTNHVRYHHSLSDENKQLKDIDWFEWRSKQGLLTKLPNSMLEQLWECLSHADHIVFGDLQSNTTLDCNFAASSMTPGEDTFAILIESLTANIYPVWYKSLIFEALYAFIQYCQRHPECKFQSEVNLPILVSQAAQDHAQHYNKAHPGSASSQAALDELAQLTPTKANQYLSAAVGKLQHA